MLDASEYAADAALAEAHYDRLERKADKKLLYGDYPDQILLEEVIRCGRAIDTFVPNNGFPAFSIALDLWGNCKTPTHKQRQALINVLASYKT